MWHKIKTAMPKIIGIPKVRFNLFDWNTIEETYIILYYQYRKGVRLKYSTGWKIRPNDWDRRKQRAKHSKRFEDSTYLNAHLDKLEQACYAIYIEHGKGKITPEAFRQELKIRIGEAERPEDADVQPPTFLEFVEQYYQERKSQPNANANTLKVIHKVKVHLQAYAAERRRKLEFGDLNEKFFRDLTGWLHAAPRSLSTNYVHKVFQYIKHFSRIAEQRDYHNSRAYQGFKLPKTPVSKIALSFGELERLAALNLVATPHLERSRDLFLIGAYSGLRFSDFTRLRPEHIQEHQGAKVIGIKAEKTDQMIYLPLLPILDSVLKKYGYTSPKISNQKMNGHLKEIGQMAGLTGEIIINENVGGISREKKVPKWEMLTTHVARRSFATNFYQAYPHLIDQIRRITGHTTEQQFRAYIVTDALDSALHFAKTIAMQTAT